MHIAYCVINTTTLHQVQAKQAAARDVSQFVLSQPISIFQECVKGSAWEILRRRLVISSPYPNTHPQLIILHNRSIILCNERIRALKQIIPLIRHIPGILIQWRPRNHHRPFILLVERLVLLAVSSTQQPPLLPLTPPPRVRQYRSLPGKGNSLLDESGIPNISKPSINTNSCAAHSPKSVLFPPSFHKQATWERPRVVNLRTMTSSRRMRPSLLHLIGSCIMRKVKWTAVSYPFLRLGRKRCARQMRIFPVASCDA